MSYTEIALAVAVAVATFLSLFVAYKQSQMELVSADKTAGRKLYAAPKDPDPKK